MIANVAIIRREEGSTKTKASHNTQPPVRREVRLLSSMSTSVPHLPGVDTKPRAKFVQWPCANCHSMISEERCPFCHGIQVKIKNDGTAQTLPKAWIERVSPTTVRGGSSSPQSRKEISSQELIIDNELIELDEEDEAELEQTDSSPRHEFDEEDIFGRPYNPVALLLATTSESPLPKIEMRADDSRREDLKKSSRERAQEGSSTPAKKQRILFAM